MVLQPHIRYYFLWWIFFVLLSISPCLERIHPAVFHSDVSLFPFVCLSVCPTLSLPSGLPATLSLAGSLRLKWWFRAHCEFSNPIQRQPKSKGGEEALGELGRQWATRGIMGVPMAISMMSGARGALALYLPSGLPIAVSLYFRFTSLSHLKTRKVFTVPFGNPLSPQTTFICTKISDCGWFHWEDDMKSFKLWYARTACNFWDILTPLSSLWHRGQQ